MPVTDPPSQAALPQKHFLHEAAHALALYSFGFVSPSISVCMVRRFVASEKRE